MSRSWRPRSEDERLAYGSLVKFIMSFMMNGWKEKLPSCRDWAASEIPCLLEKKMVMVLESLVFVNLYVRTL